MYVTTRRRFEGIGENHGFSACREYHFSGHERVLVLLRSHPAMGREHRRGGQNPSELRPHGGAVPFHSVHETVCRPSCLPCPVWVRRVSRVRKSLGGRIWTALAVGFVLFFLNWWILALPLPLEAVTGLYILTIGTGYVCLLMGGLWMSRLLKHNLMEDVFNNENESFMQETRLIESEYSVNLPTRFYYKKRWNNGWINVVNPFRASIVLGTPGSGKSYAVVNNFIKQQIEKGFSQYIYDFKFTTCLLLPTTIC